MEWKDKKILVNGASGFIGSAISKKLLKMGAKVYSIDYSINKITNFDKRIFLIEGDVSKKETWEKVPKEIDYIFHFASPSSVTLFKKEPERCFNVTFWGLYHALEFAKKNGVKKLIYPSTGNVYSGNEFPHIETIFPKPQNLYTASKVACEALANSYADFVKSIGLRISAGYGPGEERKMGFGSPAIIFLKDLMEGKSPEIWGDGSQTRDMVYIEDLVKMIIKSAEIDYSGILNVGSGESVSFKELIEKINKILKVNIKPKFIPKEVNYVEKIELDLALNKNLLGIKSISLEEGLNKFIDYLKASS
ncbi:SDR family NAD(P)-dependent oxidoreductase [Candidatus Pacearchaeota archaeon]|nr:MAG: hypothetical protein QJ16_C0007G0026 [archaeon GW2011_AR1]MBS3078389.1 SDR family NAD(P)-dependent oxidoreductase [Candidatus Pacearchaeota archaeon]HIH51959.1 SDR family NAD(P)-dependent oxidoreductase [Nanoarchaeota archaeon]